MFAGRDLELMVCSSFSKNFGLYNERVGAVTLLANELDAANKALSQLRVTVRSNYSNPPSYGAAIVNKVLSEPELNAMWHNEVDAMRGLFAFLVLDRSRANLALARRFLTQASETAEL